MRYLEGHGQSQAEYISQYVDFSYTRSGNKMQVSESSGRQVSEVG
jgi:hypothetical protein